MLASYHALRDAWMFGRVEIVQLLPEREAGAEVP
jgi:hypothetical protein